MSYVRKLGASALVIAAAFAVAFAVLISSAKAEVYSNIPTDTSAGTEITAANNGDTVYIKNDNGSDYVRFEIEATGSASASFTHSDAADDGQSILCRQGGEGVSRLCDADTRVGGGGGITVALKIDDDSGKGVIFVKQTDVDGMATVTIDTIDITVAQVATKLTVTPSPKSINSGQGSAEAGTTVLTLRLTDADGKGIAGESLTVIASHGALSIATRPTKWDDLDIEAGEGVGFTGGGTQVGSVATSADADGITNKDGAGYAAVVLTGGGVPGVATVTVRVTSGTLTGSGDIVMFGPVKEITAEAEQSAIAVGESTFIVVTATDSAGNPVTDATASVKAQGGIVAPTKAGIPVGKARDVNKDGGTKGTVQKGDIPACGTVPLVDNAEAPAVNTFEAAGTNADGMCVLQITATDETGTDDDAGRGEHTITIVASGDGADVKGIDEVELVIQVGGAPATISSDAPGRIDPSTELTVNISVVDDEGIAVGSVPIQVIKTAGDGAIITAAAASTSDGVAKFTYLAPSTPGVVEFLVRTKDKTPAAKVTSQLPIIINIAEAMEEVVEPEVVEPEVVEPEVVEPEVVEPVEPDVMVDPTLAPAAAGSVTLTSFSGGSVEQLKAALSECGSGVAAHVTVSGVGWVSYVPGAAIPAANAPFNAQFADGIPAGTLFQVTNCN